MAQSTGYIFGFSAVICVVCSLAVAGTSQGLKERIQINKQRDFQRSILTALQVQSPDGQPLAGPIIDTLYDERVELLIVDRKGQVVQGKTIDDVKAAAEATDKGGDPALSEVYVRKDGDKIGAYALSADGKGLWGDISGFIAVNPDGQTVSGATFFAPAETPGLGYEITAEGFTSQWPGKKLFKGKKAKSIRVVKGDSKLLCEGELDYCVDGVSGATLTSNGVNDMIAKMLKEYEPYLRTLQVGGSR